MSSMILYLIFMWSMFLLIMVPYNFKESHPLVVGVVMLMVSILVSLQMNFFNKSSIFSMIMYLIIIGGLLVMFLYFNSFAINSKMIVGFSILKGFFFKVSLGGSVLFYIWLNLDFMSLFMMLNNKMLEMNSFWGGGNKNNFDLDKFYLEIENLILFCMIYLFYVLVLLVKMIFFYNPKSIRQMF